MEVSQRNIFLPKFVDHGVLSQQSESQLEYENSSCGCGWWWNTCLHSQVLHKLRTWLTITHHACGERRRLPYSKLTKPNSKSGRLGHLLKHFTRRLSKGSVRIEFGWTQNIVQSMWRSKKYKRDMYQFFIDDTFETVTMLALWPRLAWNSQQKFLPQHPRW